MSRGRSVGEALPREIARICCDVMPHYYAIGSAGTYALMMMNRDVRAACEALATQDVIGMIAALKALEDYTT